MNVIELCVKNQKMTFYKPCELVAGTVGRYGVKITYDEEWDKTPHRLIMFAGCDIKKIEDTGEVIEIPHEVLKRPCYLKFGLLGLDGKGNVRITTYSSAKDSIRVLPADWRNGDEIAEQEKPAEPTPTLWESKVDKDQGAENAGKLLYISSDGKVTSLELGAGLAIQGGKLVITSAPVTSSILGTAKLGELTLA